VQLAIGLLSIILAAEPSDPAAAKASIDRMRSDLTFLSSDELEGRGINTEGINKAAEHIREQFKKVGLKSGTPDGSFFQPFKYGQTYKINNDKTRFEIAGKKLEAGKDFSPMHAGGSSPFKGQVAFVGYGITTEGGKYDDYKGVDVAGKIVVVLRRTPRQGVKDDPVFSDAAKARYESLESKLTNAINHKAAGILFVTDPHTVKDAAADKLEDPNYMGRGRGQRIPVAHITQTTANTLLADSNVKSVAEAAAVIEKDLKPQSVVLSGVEANGQFEFLPQQLDLKNVVGVIEGSGPNANETIVIGAHYDHVGYGNGFGASLGGAAARGRIHHGADDNGSGTTAMIELARRFASRKSPPTRRLVFIAFSAEETNLNGSKHYASSSPLFPLKDTIAMLNMDMVGRLREGKLEIAGNKSATEFEPLLAELNKTFKFDLKLGPAAIRGDSDHASFSNVGIPVLFFFTGLHPQYHRPTDTVDLINFEGMNQIVDLAEAVVERWTTMPRPTFVRPPKSAFALLGQRRSTGPRLGFMPGDYDAKNGVPVGDVNANSPAEKGGIMKGDVITKIGDDNVTDMETYMGAMRKLKIGDKVKIQAKRGKETVTLDVELFAPPSDSGPPSSEKKAAPKTDAKKEPVGAKG